MTLISRILLAVLIPFLLTGEAYALDDSKIKDKIIQQSIASYAGNCPCPYNTDRAGTSCGRRSAYSRAGGYAPVCYAADVTQEMIKNYKSRLR